jgi:hypothetical protein
MQNEQNIIFATVSMLSDEYYYYDITSGHTPKYVLQNCIDVTTQATKGEEYASYSFLTSALILG